MSGKAKEPHRPFDGDFLIQLYQSFATAHKSVMLEAHGLAFRDVLVAALDHFANLLPEERTTLLEAARKRKRSIA